MASDVLRYADAVLALGLVIASGWSAVLAERWDQRARFVIFGVFAFLLTSSHLSVLGQSGSWRLPVLVAVVAAAVVATVANIRTELQEREARERAARGRRAR